MKILHLFSNSKWTGPAEPALNLCVALRRLGVEADFACSPGTDENINKIVERARDHDIEPILQFSLSKHRHPIKNWLDRRALLPFLRSRHYDLVHCHLDNDHLIALGPAAKLGIPLVRSSYHGTGFSGKELYAKLLRTTAHLIEPSQMAGDHDAAAFGYPADKMTVIPGAVDTERFDPAREVPDGRRWLGIPHDAFVVGIIARMQTHRHYEDFFKAIRKLIDEARKNRGGNVRAIVVGRGTKQGQVGQQPVQALGLDKNVHFSGYVDGENYVGMLKAFDVKVFLTPGSDGTCRAVREAMAMGKPGVVADRGMLREIVDDGVNGLVCDGSAEGLFKALHGLATNRPTTRAFGRAAFEKARALFSLDHQAQEVLKIYSRLVS